jgi:hypothetical protein
LLVNKLSLLAEGESEAFFARFVFRVRTRMFERNDGRWYVQDASAVFGCCAFWLGAWWYHTGPARTVEAWLACGSDPQRLVTASDAAFWDEYQESVYIESMRTYEAACLRQSEITKVEINGRTAKVTVATAVPALSYDDTNKFGAMPFRVDGLPCAAVEVGV